MEINQNTGRWTKNGTKSSGVSLVNGCGRAQAENFSNLCDLSAFINCNKCHIELEHFCAYTLLNKTPEPSNVSSLLAALSLVAPPLRWSGLCGSFSPQEAQSFMLLLPFLGPAPIVIDFCVANMLRVTLFEPGLARWSPLTPTVCVCLILTYERSHFRKKKHSENEVNVL